MSTLQRRLGEAFLRAGEPTLPITNRLPCGCVRGLAAMIPGELPTRIFGAAEGPPALYSLRASGLSWMRTYPVLCEADTEHPLAAVPAGDYGALTGWDT
jgi:hypothetical protein